MKNFSIFLEMLDFQKISFKIGQLTKKKNNENYKKVSSIENFFKYC
jgi:hypothetical protein